MLLNQQYEKSFRPFHPAFLFFFTLRTARQKSRWQNNSVPVSPVSSHKNPSSCQYHRSDPFLIAAVLIYKQQQARSRDCLFSFVMAEISEKVHSFSSSTSSSMFEKMAATASISSSSSTISYSASVSSGAEISFKMRASPSSSMLSVTRI